MADFQLRPAEEADMRAIRRLIHEARINPNGLDWPRFVLAVSGSGEVVGCGQLKPHSGDVMELASLAVTREYQSRGIGRALIEHLIKQGPRPLYLMCRPELGSLYEKFGFHRLTVKEMPAYFRRIRQMMGAYERLVNVKEMLLVMKLK